MATCITLTSPGSRLSIRGEFFAKTVVKNEPFRFRMIVVRNRVGSNLLSRNTAEKMSLVKLLDEVHENLFGKTGLLKTNERASP